MPKRSRGQPSSIRGPFRLLAAGLRLIGLLAACGSVTPTGSAATVGPPSGGLSPSPSPAPSATSSTSTAPGVSPTPPDTGGTTPPAPAISWRRVAVPGVPATTERVGIGPNRIVVAVDGPSDDGSATGNVAFWSSTDTVHWVASTHVPGADDGIVTAVVAVGHGFVAVGTDAGSMKPRAWTSVDGRRWTVSQAIALGAGATAAAMTSVAAGTDGLVAGGFTDTTERRMATAWVSVDGGQTWRPSIVDGSGPRAEVTSVAAGGPGWLATGIRDANAAFWVSRDGRAWGHVVPQPPVGGGPGAESIADGVACIPGRCVAVGQGPHAGDGWALWYEAPAGWKTLGAGDALTGGASRSVVAFGDGFVAGGAGADGRFGIWTTADGRHWTAAPAAGPTGVVEDLASDGTRIVGVGSPLEGGSGFAIWIGTATP